MKSKIKALTGLSPIALTIFAILILVLYVINEQHPEWEKEIQKIALDNYGRPALATPKSLDTALYPSTIFFSSSKKDEINEFSYPSNRDSEKMNIRVVDFDKNGKSKVIATHTIAFSQIYKPYPVIGYVDGEGWHEIWDSKQKYTGVFPNKVKQLFY